MTEVNKIAIQPIKAFNDNYIWVIINVEEKRCVVVDPGQPEPVINFLKNNNLHLDSIWITHKHADHTGGVASLQEIFPQVKVFAHTQHGVRQTETLKEGIQIHIFGCSVDIWELKGHTEHHLGYLLTLNHKKHVFCGDTLFSGGCGRVFTGDMSSMFHSLTRLLNLAEDTLFYPAHEYTANNLKFGLHIEPTNLVMESHLKHVLNLNSIGMPSLPTSLKLEKQINVFLRTAEQSVIDAVSNLTCINSHEPLEVFTKLRELKDGF